MIRNVIFDIGGVLLEYNPNTHLDKLKIEESKQKELKNIIFRNPKWNKRDKRWTDDRIRCLFRKSVYSLK